MWNASSARLIKLDEQLPRHFVPLSYLEVAVERLFVMCTYDLSKSRTSHSDSVENCTISPEVLTFVNGLSDYLFVYPEKLILMNKIVKIFWDNSWK